MMLKANEQTNKARNTIALLHVVSRVVTTDKVAFSYMVIRT